MGSGIIQEVINGQIKENPGGESSKKSGNDMGYDQFLQILCAEMQYQDPLEPTSNTEYVAQLATFSQLESTLSMQNTVESSSANALVGKYVIMKTTSPTTGQVSYASGTVDYVLHQNGKTFLSIGDSLYDIKDLDTVADMDYMEAVMIAQDFAAAVRMLPSKYEITLGDRETLEKMEKLYNELNDYQKSFIGKDVYAVFKEKLDRLKELIEASGEGDGDGTDVPEVPGDGDGTETPEVPGDGDGSGSDGTGDATA